MEKKINYRKEQLHAGNIAKLSEDRREHKVWHTDEHGLYWCGNWYSRTPKQLLDECTTTIRDLLLNHPELLK